MYQLVVLVCFSGLLWGQAQCACPHGFEEYSESCYALPRVKATWSEALQYCEAIGAELAVIEDSDEEQFVHQLLQRKQSIIKSSQVWIGGTDLIEEGVWVAPKTLEPLTFLNWAPGEPDDLMGQHCLAIFMSATLDWDDNKCEVENFALCERPLSDEPDIVG